MYRPLNLSSSIIRKTPKERRVHTQANLRWIARHAKLTGLEALEVHHALMAFRLPG